MKLRWSAAASLLVLAGCSGFDPGYRFQPEPALLLICVGEVEAGRIEATVAGAREGSGTEPATIHVKMRVERCGPLRVAAPPDKMTLRTADGRTLAVHTVDPPDPRIPAEEGASKYLVVFALMRPADLDDVLLSSLDLCVEVEVGEERRMCHLRFEREMRDHPWWNPWGPGPE